MLVCLLLYEYLYLWWVTTRQCVLYWMAVRTEWSRVRWGSSKYPVTTSSECCSCSWANCDELHSCDVIAHCTLVILIAHSSINTFFCSSAIQTATSRLGDLMQVRGWVHAGSSVFDYVFHWHWKYLKVFPCNNFVKLFLTYRFDFYCTSA